MIGLDSSGDMVEAARARGIDAFVADAEALGLDQQVERFGQFDAVFSNAALHWMLDPDAVATGIFAMLKQGGRFVGEMGGAGNIAILRAGIEAELVERGYPVPADQLQWYPAVEEFTRIYGAAGFTEIEARLIDRPTDLPDGVAGWVRTFRSGLFDVAMVPEWRARTRSPRPSSNASRRELRKPDGSYFADYVRLRFSMRKPGRDWDGVAPNLPVAHSEEIECVTCLYRTPTASRCWPRSALRRSTICSSTCPRPPGSAARSRASPTMPARWRSSVT